MLFSIISIILRYQAQQTKNLISFPKTVIANISHPPVLNLIKKV